MFFLMIRRPPRSTPFPTRRSSDLILFICGGAFEGLEEIVGKRTGKHNLMGFGAVGHEKTDDEESPLHNLTRSEEHTSELQSRQYLVCRLLLEKKNNYNNLIQNLL